MHNNSTPPSANNGGKKYTTHGLSIQKDYKIGKKSVFKPGQNKRGPLCGAKAKATSASY